MNTEMPIRVKPYKHQKDAYEYALRLYGAAEGGDARHSMRSRGTALLMEM